MDKLNQIAVVCEHAIDQWTVRSVPELDTSDEDGCVVIEATCKKCGKTGSMVLKPSELSFD